MNVKRPAASGRVLKKEVERQYKTSRIGLVDEGEEEFYAISVERRVTYPAVSIVVETARKSLFANN